MRRHMTFEELVQRLTRILAAHGMSEGGALVIADRMAGAQRDGALSHGLLRLPGYIATLESGWVDGRAVPTVQDTAPAWLSADAHNGFAQVALEAASEQLVDKARRAGVALLAIRNSHHFAALWPDVEPFAEKGFVSLGFVNAQSRILTWDAKRKLLGTNPMAFACPRENGPPLVFDQASSVVAHGEVLRAARDGHEVADGTGVDAAGKPTRDPKAILADGALMPFGGHKGSAIALMIEVMAAALTGGQFGYEHNQAGYSGAQTTRAGQCIILIDPARAHGNHFAMRVERLLRALAGSGVSRLPGDKRYECRSRAVSEGIPLSADERALLERFSSNKAAGETGEARA